MEMKHNVWVYVELIDGKLSQVSLELLGKGRELADAKNNSLVALIIGEGAGKVGKCAIGFGADAAVVVEDAALAKFNSNYNFKNQCQ